MAKKPNITTISSGYASNTQFNANFEALRDSFDNTLSRDGSTPNSMSADLDLNSNDINNVGNVNTSSLYLNGQLISVNTSLTGAGSGDVGYTSTKSNAVARTVLAKLDDITSVRDFGALADGSTDDLAAINKALTASSVVLFPAGTYRVSNLPAFNGHALLATNAVLKVDAGQLTCATVDLQDAGGITFQGQDTTETALSNISSVSGSAGNYTVTATLASASGISVGDVVKVRAVSSGVPTVPGLITSRPVIGQLNIGFFQMGELTSSGTSVSLSKNVATTYLAVGDLIFAKGQIRRVSGSLTNNSFTIDAAFEDDIAGLQYWFNMQDSSNGTVSVSGTTVTGSGTAFDDDLNPGDLIFINGSGPRRIASVDSATQLTLEVALTSSAAIYGYLTLGETHEGAWLVSAVSGNQVTWKNTSRGKKPPVNNVVGGTVIVSPTQASFTGDGFIIKTGTASINNIAMKGDSGTADIGLNQKEDGLSSYIVLEGHVSVANFGYGAWVHGGSYLYAQDQCFSGNTTRGLNIAEGGSAWLAGSITSGNTGFGIFLGSGAFAKMNATKSIGNSSFGVRKEVGASCFFDFGQCIDNGSAGVYEVGGALTHMIGCRFIGNDSNGYTGNNGAYGRLSGAMFLCNTNAGIALNQSNLEANQINSCGNGGSGVVSSRSRLSLEEAGLGYNAATGLTASAAANVSLDLTHVVGNIGVGVSCVELSHVTGATPALEDNGSSDVFVATGGKVSVTNAAGSFTKNVAVNIVQPDGEVITDGNATGFGVSALSVGAGDNLNLVKKFSQVNNLGTVGANGSASFAFTATGAATTNSVALVNCNVPVTGLVYSAQCTAANQITVTASNVTGSGVAAGNKTYTIVLLDF